MEDVSTTPKARLIESESISREAISSFLPVPSFLLLSELDRSRKWRSDIIEHLNLRRRSSIRIQE